MRLTTTLVLLIMAAGCGWLIFWQQQHGRPADVHDAASKDLLAITPASLLRIDINDAQLTKSGSVWTLPGDWPTRTAEVNELVGLLCGLHTRFSPLTFTKADDFGFDAERKPQVIKVTVRLPDQGEKTLTLIFGEPALAGNPFTRPTFVRIDDRAEVLRLEPGLLAKLRKSREDFQRRQLFPAVVRTKISDGAKALSGDGDLAPAAVALLEATQLSAASPDGSWTLKRTSPLDAKSRGSAPLAVTVDQLAGMWELTAPVTDHVDPDKLRGVLAAVPELWVEAFLPDADPQVTGLDAPERTIAVTMPEQSLKVLIGKVSRIKEIKPPAPPAPANPFSPPPPPPQPLREEYRYAKLPNNPQLFEVRGDRLGELFVKPAELRDARLARYKSDDVRQIELNAAGRNLLFVKTKEPAGEEKWKIQAPVQADADAAKVLELIDKLAQLQVRGADAIDSADLKPYGLAEGDPTTQVTITTGPPDQAKRYQYRFGRHDAANAKLFVQVQGQARINAVPDDLLKYLDRTVLAYRSRRLLDVPVSQVAKMVLDRPTDGLTLAQAGGTWSLTAPANVPADQGKAAAMATELARLEATEFVNFAPTPDELKQYGLDTATVRATVFLPDRSLTLLIGKPREGKPEVYAKLADAAEVFALREAMKATLEQPSLAFRPLQLWQAPGLSVKRIDVQRGGESYSLLREVMAWKIAGPFDASAFLPSVQALLDAASRPRAERFETHVDDDLARFGLDNPAMSMAVTLVAERADSPNGIRKLLIGKPVADGQPARFARLEGSPGIFVLGPSVIEAVNQPALELLDRRVLGIDTRQVNRIEGTGPSGPWSAKRVDQSWMIDSLNPPMPGDRTAIENLLGVLTDLRATRFAGYGDQAAAKFGLDQPVAKFQVQIPAGDKPVVHTIFFGQPVEGNPQARYARIAASPAIAVLPPGPTQELTRSALDLVHRGLFNFPAKDLISIRRTMSGQELLLEKVDGQWKITAPTSAAADEPALLEMAERLSSLRAHKVASVGVKNFAEFGLEPPAATVILSLRESDGKNRELLLHLGKAMPDGRAARLGDADTVFLLPDSATDPLATRLSAEPIKFRDRGMARFAEADRVTVQRGERSATFAKVDGQWKMTAPIAADAEAFDLDDLMLLSSKLRADELLADNPTDLQPFGLAQPEAELRFFLGDKEVLKLKVGKRDAAGRATVQAGGGGLVGKLEPAVSSRLLAEFRRRALWGNLDVAQAETVIINSGSGSPIVINKTEAGWQFADGSSQSVNAETVSSLLAAMAGLKVERFVVDRQGDRKLYGLDPANRVIVVKTRTGGMTTLHLGRMEGDSQRIYAAIPGGDGAIALLSEADSGKLMRPVQEFRGR